MADFKSQIPGWNNITMWRSGKKLRTAHGNHGDFLLSFADAVVRADHENLGCLISASIFLIHKYKLLSYLEAPHAK